MLIVGANLSAETFYRQHASFTGQGSAADTTQNRGGASFKNSDMPEFMNQQFIAGQAVSTQTHLIGLRSRAGKDGGFLTKHLTDHGFEPIDCRVFPIHVIAQFCRNHCLQHCGCGSGFRVTAKVDERRTV